MNTLEARNILGIQPGPINGESLKKNYRLYVKKYHPDSCGSAEESELKIREINEAYRILQDEANGVLSGTIESFPSTFIITPIQLNAVLKGNTVSTQEGLKLNKENIRYFNVLVRFEWFISYQGNIARFSQIVVYEPLKVYKLSCEILVDEDKPEIKLRAYNQDRLIRINYAASSIIMMIQDVQVEITIRKRMVKSNG